MAAVGLGGRTYAKAFRQETGITFPLLVDKDRVAYQAVGLKSVGLHHLLHPENFAARKRAKKRGHSQHKLGKDPLQLGASFVFAPGDQDLFVHISETFGNTAEVSDLIDVLKG